MSAPHASLTTSSVEPGSRIPLLQKIRDAVNSAPLLANGYAMVVSTGLTSVFGVVFWMAATHFYDQRQVGLAATLIAAMTTIGYFGQLNLGTVLNRFLPRAGAGASALIVKAYVAAGLFSGALAIAFSQGVGLIATPLEIFRGDPVTTGVFVIATITWTVFALQDSALSGLRFSVVIPFENTAYAFLKIVIVTALAFGAPMAVSGIYLGWTLALVPVVLAVNILIFRHLATRLDRALPAENLDLKTIARFLSWDFAGSLFLAGAFGLAPLMIATAAGVEANAPYHIAWTIAYSVYLIGRSMGISLLAESAAFPKRRLRLTADAFCHTMILVTAAVIVLLVAAPLVLMLFGTVYVTQGTAILRVLLLACLPWAATTIIIASLRAQGRTRPVAMIQLATLAIFALSSLLLLPLLGALGVAWGWLISHSAVLAGIVTVFLIRAPHGSVAGHGLLVATAIADIAGSVFRRLRKSAGAAPPEVGDRYGRIAGIDLSGWHLAGAPRSVSDCTTLIYAQVETPLPADGSPNKVIVKRADTVEGMAALERGAEVLTELNSDTRLQDLQANFPQLLGIDRPEGAVRTAETGLSGQDGQKMLGPATDTQGAFAEVASFLAELHRRTARSSVLGESWAARWIDAPVGMLIEASGRHRKQLWKETVLLGLRQDLRRILIGRNLPLGRGHGDLSPGNVLFGDGDVRHRGFRLSGLIDWDNSRADAPLAVDLYHFALTLKMLETGEELGALVRARFLEDRSDTAGIVPPEIQSTLDTLPGCDDEDGRRAMVTLAWLHHVAANLTKSRRYARNPLWMISNVDRVLSAIALRSGGSDDEA